MANHKDADTFRAKLKRAGISHVAFGQWIDRDPRTMTRWASGRENIPAYAWVALDTLLAASAKERKVIDRLVENRMVAVRQAQRERRAAMARRAKKKAA